MSSQLDLNLLLVFDAVMGERNYRLAGERLSRTQPAISQAVSRMRVLIGDPLFIRSPTGVTPTARAEILWAEVREPLTQLKQALEPTEFDPKTMTSELVFGLSDDSRILFWPEIALALASAAPKVTTRALDTNHVLVWDELREGRFDLALTVASQPPAGFDSHTILQDNFVILHNRTNQSSFTAKSFAASRHLAIVFPEEQTAYTDETLSSLGLSRQVIARVQRFDALPALIKQLDAIIALPESIASYFANQYGLATSKIPVPFPPAILKLCWNQKTHNDPRHVWVRKLVIDTLTAQLHSKIRKDRTQSH